jgi:hypothetical protein
MTGVWRIHILIIEEVPGYLALNTPSLLCRLPKEPWYFCSYAPRGCATGTVVGFEILMLDLQAASVERLYLTTVYIAWYRSNQTENAHITESRCCAKVGVICCKNSTSSALRNTLAPLILIRDGDWLYFRVGYGSPVKRMHVPRQ